MRPSVWHPSICPQSAQVSSPFSRTQLCTGQSLSQNGVFAPSTRQPVQRIMSGVIVTALSFVHRAAVFSRRASLFVIVAILASQVSQSSTQHAMSFLGSRFASIFAFFSLRSIRAAFPADAGELRPPAAERALLCFSSKYHLPAFQQRSDLSLGRLRAEKSRLRRDGRVPQYGFTALGRTCPPLCRTRAAFCRRR